MARKKNKSSGDKGGGKQNQPKKSAAPQQQKGLGSGSVRQNQPSAPSVNLATKYSIRNVGTNGDIVITGSEIIGVAASTNQGALIFIADLNPVTWAGTRAARMIPLFETYAITDLRVTYIPSCNTTTGGLMYMYYDRDPNDAPIPDVLNAGSLTRLMSNQNAVAGQIWKPLSMSYKAAPADLKGYYAAPIDDAGDLRLTSQGAVYAYSSAQAAAAGGGLFKFDYTIKLMTPTGPTATPTSAGPWIFGPINTPGTAGGVAVVPTPIPATSGVSDHRDKIYQILLEYGTSFLVENTTKSLSPYTPIFMRNLMGTWRAYLTIGSAIAWTSDFLAGTSGAYTGSGWSRIVSNLMANSSGETV